MDRSNYARSRAPIPSCAATMVVLFNKGMKLPYSEVEVASEARGLLGK